MGHLLAFFLFSHRSYNRKVLTSQVALNTRLTNLIYINHILSQWLIIGKLDEFTPPHTNCVCQRPSGFMHCQTLESQTSENLRGRRVQMQSYYKSFHLQDW